MKFVYMVIELEKNASFIIVFLWNIREHGFLWNLYLLLHIYGLLMMLSIAQIR